MCHPSLFMSRQFFSPTFSLCSPHQALKSTPWPCPTRCRDRPIWSLCRRGMSARQGKLRKKDVITDHRRLSATPVDKEAAERSRENSFFGFCQKNKCGGRGATSNSRARLRKEFPLPKDLNSSGNNRERSRLGKARGRMARSRNTIFPQRFNGAVREPPKTRQSMVGFVLRRLLFVPLILTYFLLWQSTV